MAHLISMAHSVSVISPAANLLMIPTASSGVPPRASMAFHPALTGPDTHFTALWTPSSLATVSKVSARPTEVVTSCLAAFCFMPYSWASLRAIFWGLSFILMASAISFRW